MLIIACCMLLLTHLSEAWGSDWATSQWVRVLEELWASDPIDPHVISEAREDEREVHWLKRRGSRWVNCCRGPVTGTCQNHTNSAEEKSVVESCIWLRTFPCAFPWTFQLWTFHFMAVGGGGRPAEKLSPPFTIMLKPMEISTFNITVTYYWWLTSFTVSIVVIGTLCSTLYTCMHGIVMRF